jgi:P pilus assembly chaperone PapD
MRLVTNLTFLATISDTLLFGQQQQSVVDHTSMERYYQIPKEQSKASIIKSLPPPIMIQIETDALQKPNPKQFVPVPPLVGQNPNQEMSLSGYTILDTDSCHVITLKNVTRESKDGRTGNRNRMMVHPTIGSRLETIDESDSDSDTEYKQESDDDESIVEDQVDDCFDELFTF